MKKFIKILLIIAFWIICWQVISLIINLPVLFPAPIDVLKRFGELLVTTEYYKSTLFSFGRIFLGILIAIVLGIIMAIICYFSKIIYDFFNPFVTVIKSTPIVAFVFLVNIYTEDSSTVIMICSIIVFPIVFANVYQGLKGTNTELLEFCKVYNVPFSKKLTSLYFPTVLPYFVSSLLSAIGLAWKAGIAAEVLCFPKTAIGTEIYNVRLYGAYVDMYAWVITVIVLSLIFEVVITKLLKLVSKKYSLNMEEKNEN